MKFLMRLKRVLGISTELFYQTESEIQDTLAPILRQKAIHHLAYADSFVAKGFRGEYLASGEGRCQDFLRRQKEPHVWGTYIEATALGADLGCHVVVTPIKEGVEQETFCLYHAEDDEAPTIHLYNRDNLHWFVNAQTKGNGDCLYNAISQTLYGLVQSELPVKASIPTEEKPRTLGSHRFLQGDKSATKKVIARQKAIEAVISYPKPNEMETSLLEETKRIQGLSAEEQQQIADDYQLALRLAAKECGVCTNKLFTQCIQHDSPYHILCK